MCIGGRYGPRVARYLFRLRILAPQRPARLVVGNCRRVGSMAPLYLGAPRGETSFFTPKYARLRRVGAVARGVPGGALQFTRNERLSIHRRVYLICLRPRPDAAGGCPARQLRGAFLRKIRK